LALLFLIPKVEILSGNANLFNTSLTMQRNKGFQGITVPMMKIFIRHEVQVQRSFTKELSGGKHQ